MQLGEGCAIRIYQDDNRLGVQPTRKWFVYNVQFTRFPGYTRT